MPVIPTGKSRLSFFRGNCGACADPSVFSLISFEIPSPFPKENHGYKLNDHISKYFPWKIIAPSSQYLFSTWMILYWEIFSTARWVKIHFVPSSRFCRGSTASLAVVLIHEDNIGLSLLWEKWNLTYCYWYSGPLIIELQFTYLAYLPVYTLEKLTLLPY